MSRTFFFFLCMCVRMPAPLPPSETAVIYVKFGHLAICDARAVLGM